MKTKLHFFLFISIFTSLIIQSQTQKAKYNVTFTSVWNTSDHGNLPGNAHWSRLVGATHKTSGSFFEIGKKATTGIKNVAETGNNSVFNAEVNTAITNNESDQYINGSSLSTATGNITINDVTVDRNYNLLSLASMIAPSPDWIIGVNGVNLLDEDNNWKSSISIDLYAYDVGTDSGLNYTSSNAVTNPTNNITSLKGVSPFNNKKIGTLSITLLETLSLDKNLKNSLKLYYNSSLDKIIINNKENYILDKLEIYSVIGKLVQKEDKINQSISLQGLAKGLYLVKIKTDKGIILRKIVK
jgi:hypothetical protein